ncbi:MAG TPA: helix-turn-helix domain-containing protein [Polyangiaceae bacterium]
MDDFSFHLQPVARRYPSELQVAHLGNMPAKSHLVRREFSTHNFSFVFRGTGFYEWRGTRYPVHGPTVLRQWPAEPMHYGPHGRWHELYIVYSPTATDTLARRGYVTSERPLWSIGDTRGVQRHLDDLSRLLANPAALADQIDRIDRSCEQLILESLIGAAATPMESAADRVGSLRRWIETHWRKNHDFDELARRHGLSPTHFRRLWQRNVGVPPQRFLIEERLRHASRALVQTDAPIAEIARAHGFGDPLYFSRRFRAFTGESASAYRRRYRASLQF